MNQINLVDDRAPGKLTCAVARSGNLLVFVFLDHAGQGFGESLQRGRNGLRQFRQIHNR